MQLKTLRYLTAKVESQMKKDFCPSPFCPISCHRLPAWGSLSITDFIPLDGGAKMQVQRPWKSCSLAFEAHFRLKLEQSDVQWRRKSCRNWIPTVELPLQALH